MLFYQIGINFYIKEFRDKRISSLIESEVWSESDIKSFVNRITDSYNRQQDISPCSKYPFRRNTGLRTQGGDNIFIYLPRDKFFP